MVTWLVKKKNNETIDKIVRYDEMRDIRQDLGIEHNKVFCGYLRQPITAHKNEDGYFIAGTCALNNYCVCARNVTPNTDSPTGHDNPTICDTYRKRIYDPTTGEQTWRRHND